MGFGFTHPHWEPRRYYAGTCDAQWEASVSPRLPHDFDPRFFNAAPSELISKTSFRGGEQIQIINGTRRHVLNLLLPRVPPPRFRVELRGRGDENLQAKLDTIIVNVDDGLLIMQWRASVRLRDPLDAETIEARMDGYQPPNPMEPFVEVKPA